MNLRTRFLAMATAVAAFAGVGLIGAIPAGAVTTYNVANDHVTCNTLTGKISFATGLKNSGPTTGANTIKVVGTVAGCTDEDKSAVKMFGGALTTTISSTNGWNCSGLLGPTNITGGARITWKAAAGQLFTPTVVVGSANKAVTDITFSQVVGGAFTVPASESPWSSSYGKFSIGTQYGTSPLHATVDFTGGDGGITSWFSGTTQQDLGVILNSCAGTGLKTLAFGIGAVHGG